MKKKWLFLIICSSFFSINTTCYANKIKISSIIAATTIGTSYYMMPSHVKQFTNTIFTGFFKGLLPNANLEKTWEAIYKKNQYIWENPTLLAHYIQQHYCAKTTFLWGVSSSAYQIEGGFDNITWKNPKTNLIEPACASDRFYKTHQNNNGSIEKIKDNDTTNQHLPTPGMAINFWNNYKKIIPQMKNELQNNAFRLSISWSRIYPKGPEYIDVSALNRYVDIIKTLKHNGIEPIVVLHHYTVPSWFEDKGGFEHLENIDLFVSFCLTVYHALHKQVTYWSTYNAIEGYAFKGYYTKEASPGIKSMEKTAQVMAHMLEAHVRVYEKIKNSYNTLKEKNNTIPKPLIGIQKNIHQLDIARNNWKQYLFSPLSGICTNIGGMMQNKAFYSFFTTGIFELWIPKKFSKVIRIINKKAPESLDWIGVNTYSNTYMCMTKRGHHLEPYGEDRITLNKNYRFYPEGIYRAVKEIAEKIVDPLQKRSGKSIPIIITENGIALGEQNDEKRKEFFQKALFTIGKAIADGYNIIGYLPWSSHDNYEWKTAKGTKRYGFFHVDFSDEKNPQITTLKESSRYYKEFISSFLQHC